MVLLSLTTHGHAFVVQCGGYVMVCLLTCAFIVGAVPFGLFGLFGYMLYRYFELAIYIHIYSCFGYMGG